jgi:hypothetical protein
MSVPAIEARGGEGRERERKRRVMEVDLLFIEKCELLGLLSLLCKSLDGVVAFSTA